MLVEDTQALLHQHVVVRDVAGGRLERFDSGFFSEGDPDFRNQYPFQVETGDFHERFPAWFLTEGGTLSAPCSRRNAGLIAEHHSPPSRWLFRGITAYLLPFRPHSASRAYN
ncbi:hypothetical protein D3C76_1221080 [compost metagenome]